MKNFTIGDDTSHRQSTARCPGYAAQLPEPCRCGGLVHASAGQEEDTDGDAVLTTQRDQCGRSREDLAEAV